MSDVTSQLPTADKSDGIVGSTVPSVAIQVGGSDGTNLRSLHLDTNNNLLVKDTTSTDVTVTGTLSAIAQTLVATNTGGLSTWTVDLRAGTGGWTVNTNIIFEYSVDGTNFNTAYGVQLNSINGIPNNGASGPTAISFQGNIAGCELFRCRVFAYNSPDTVNVTIRLTSGEAVTAIRMALPGGTNTIGSVNQGTSPWIDNITQIGGSAIALGQTTMSASLPVAIASNQTAIKINTQDGSGNAITSTVINSKQRLDVDLSSEGVDGSTAPFNSLQIGGKDPSGNLQAILTSVSGEIFEKDVINVSSQYRAQSVTTTAAEALGGATRLVNRKVIIITPTNGIIYWGTTTGVTTTTGFPLYPNQTLALSFTDNVPVYVIAATTTDTRILEGS